MSLLTNKKATSRTPQVVTLIVDDSDSMRDLADGGKSKSMVATESIQDMVMTTQANTQGSKGFRFLMNIAKFGDAVTVIAEAEAPEQIPLNKLVFHGNSGWTNMHLALEWAARALDQSLNKCRSLPAYNESGAPPPLVVFLSDGENTGPELEEAAERLRNIEFQGGRVNVIACGIGMKPEHFAVMKSLASSREMAVNIEPRRLAEFIAAVGATMRDPVKNHIDVFQEVFPDIGAPPQTPPDVQATTEATKHPDVKYPEEDYLEPNYTDKPQADPERDEVPPAIEENLNPALDRFQEWDAHMADGRTALQAGRYAEAEHEFLAAERKVHDAADGRLASTLSCLAITHAAQGDEEGAAPFAIGSLDLLSRLGPSTALSEGLEAAERLAELWSILDKPEAEDLWIRIAGFWEGPATGLPQRAGGLTALGFRHKEQGHVSEARHHFEQAAKRGGVGAEGALRGLVAIYYDSAGREGAEPFLEQLVAAVARRFGNHHALTQSVITQLGLSYVQGGHPEKRTQLQNKYK